MIIRELYLQQLRHYVDKPLIKVLTGIRRSGKSSLLHLLSDELRQKGINDSQIVQINLESFRFADIIDESSLYKKIQSLITTKNTHYILLDEIQEVKNWEKAVNAIAHDFNADIYITGSNSRLLSSELATYIAGRYVEINMHTLSFSEFIQFRNALRQDRITDHRKAFFDYLRLGGFPVINLAEYETEAACKIIFDIYSSAILRDVVQRNNIRDVELLERVVRFVFDNIGNTFSAKNVADYFKSQQRKIDLNTVYNYLSALEAAFIIHKIPRYDIKGKEILKTNEKYFIAEHSLLYAVMGYSDRWISGVLENLVMLELKRRGYRVFTGKTNSTEVDFIGMRQLDKLYIQVAWKMQGQPDTIKREFSSLLAIRDHHPKMVLSMDEHFTENIEGIRHQHIADFLLGK